MNGKYRINDEKKKEADNRVWGGVPIAKSGGLWLLALEREIAAVDSAHSLRSWEADLERLCKAKHILH